MDLDDKLPAVQRREALLAAARKYDARARAAKESAPHGACAGSKLESSPGITASELSGAPNPSGRAAASTAPSQTLPKRSTYSAEGTGTRASLTHPETPQSELLPAFDRAIKSAERHSRMIPDDKHQVFALRKARSAVIASLQRGDNLTIGMMHALPGVGHWVVSEVKAHLDENIDNDGIPLAKRPRREVQPVPAPTPQQFSWWYVSRSGKRVEDRDDAESNGRGGTKQFRVCILHSSGRMEKAFLPLAKAQLRSPAGNS